MVVAAKVHEKQIAFFRENFIDYHDGVKLLKRRSVMDEFPQFFSYIFPSKIAQFPSNKFY